MHCGTFKKCYNLSINLCLIYLLINFTMASESSFDIVSQFNLQEVRNAVDQVHREITTRYDFKDSHASIELTDTSINIVAPGEMKVSAVGEVLMQKIINRKLSPKILDFQKALPSTGELFKQEVKLVKTLDKESCKQVSELIKKNFSKVKPSIQGDAVRVSSKSKDDLQAVMAYLKQNEEMFKLPLAFENMR